MNREQQLKALKLEREQLIDDLNAVYANAFNRLSQLDVADRSIAKLIQIILLSKEAAINPLQKEVEKPLITKASKQL